MVERKRTAFFRGNAGIQQTDVELERQKQKAEQRKATGNTPFRFRTPVGETREIIICDDKPDFFMYEHGLKDADGNWGRLFTGCVKTFDNCPVCEAEKKESYYALFLTVIDLTPFQLRDGTDVDFSRKLLVVKPAQQKKFLRFYNKEGTMRGARFAMTRDGDKDSSIGNDIEFIDFVPEEEMETYTRTWKDKEGKKHSENCDEPLVYEEIFEEPTTEALRALVGGDHTPGSRGQSEREVGRRAPASRRGESEERAGRGRREEPESRGRPAARGTPKKGDDDWSEDDDRAPFAVDGEEDDAPPPRRAVRGAAPAAAAPARRGRAAPAEEAEAADEGEDDAPPPRRASRTPAPSRRAAPTRGRAAPEEPEEDDAPPPRRDAVRRTRPEPEAVAPADRAGARRARR